MNILNIDIEQVSGDLVVPFTINGTGAVYSNGVFVTGTGTLFSTELQVGGYIINTDTTEFRKVTSVTSDTTCVIEAPFTSGLSNNDCIYIPAKKAAPTAIKILPNSGSNGIYNRSGSSVPVANGQWIVITKDGRSRSSEHDIIRPLYLDASDMTVIVEY